MSLIIEFMKENGVIRSFLTIWEVILWWGGINLMKDTERYRKVVKKVLPLLITFGVGLLIWFLPRPEGIGEQGWHVLAIFIATIVGIIVRPLPMGGVAILSLGMLSVTGTLTVEQALSGFSLGAVWLVVAAFFIARAFIKTHLGTRIAYYFVKLFGKKTLGLSYSLIFSEMLLAPAIPSTTARSGGIMFPIINGLSQALNSKPHDISARNMGAFLILTSYHGCMIVSAMFLTAMAGNPLAASIAMREGVDITWGSWALGALVPGLCSLIVIPLVIYAVSTPRIKSVPDAPQFADSKLKELGKMKRKEHILLIVFVALIGLWIFGRFIGIDSVTTAILGLGALLLTNVLNWQDVIEEKGAWETLIWFSTLLTLAGYLNTFGVIGYFSELVVAQVSGMNWVWAFLILSLVYFYSHYLFASNTAHIGAMYGAILAVAIALGTPGFLAAIFLGYLSNLFGSLTHYGASPAPVLFGAGYVGVKEWWKVGALVSAVNLVIWIVIGGAWWKFLGYW